MSKNKTHKYRAFLKDSNRLTIDFSSTDQNRSIPCPPLQKPFSKEQELTTLPRKNEWKSIEKVDLLNAIKHRRSRRDYKQIPLKLDELAFLLWSTQGIKEMLGENHAYRTVPSAGCRHAFETYLAIMNVESLNSGIYRYLPVEHSVVQEKAVDNLSHKIIDATLGQEFVGLSAVVFIWASIPYRMEWRYDIAAHRVIAMDAGHVCQNLYLACEAIKSGTCAIAAYDQERMDELIGLDGQDEFTVYLAPVGKV
jgi:SagB-type dehydrogenase family enzyme